MDSGGCEAELDDRRRSRDAVLTLPSKLWRIAMITIFKKDAVKNEPLAKINVESGSALP